MTDVTPVEAPPPSNSFSRIIGIFFSPNQTFQDIARKPDWLVPALLIVLVSVVVVVIMVPRIDFDATYREAFEAQGMSAQQQDQALRIASAFGRASMYVSPLFAIGWMAVLALIYCLGVRMLGGAATFMQTFSVVLYSGMPRVLKALITIPVLLSKHGLRLQEIETVLRSNLGFLANPKTQPMLFAVLAGLDVFTIWGLILTVIGLAAVSKLSKAKTAAIVIVVACLGLLLRIGGAAMQTLRAHK